MYHNDEVNRPREPPRMAVCSICGKDCGPYTEGADRYHMACMEKIIKKVTREEIMYRRH
jgi:hypothetical protein